MPVMDDQANGYFPDLDKYYPACVAGGKGSFVVVVHNYKDYSAAMRHKLILEISQNENQIKQAESALPKNHPLVRIAATPEAATAPPPQVLRPGTNQFSQRSDIQVGFGGF